MAAAARGHRPPSDHEDPTVYWVSFLASSRCCLMTRSIFGETLRVRRVQIIDHALMLVVELGRQLDRDFLSARCLLAVGGLRMRLDHMLAELLHGVRLSFLSGDFVGLDLVHARSWRLFCTKSGVLGVPHETSAMAAKMASVASKGFRIRDAPNERRPMGGLTATQPKSPRNRPRFPARRKRKPAN